MQHLVACQTYLSQAALNVTRSMSWKLQKASPLRREVDKMQVNLDDT